jgi:predicted regulator of Ras-like GTPase activity (Roadblock/LC7/MglB family)
MFSLSTGVAVEQLRTGAVRIPFSQLRQGSPPGTFAANGTHDDSLIDLPLPLILAALGPAGLARRPDQKRAAAPDNVAGVFGVKHSQFNYTAEKVEPTWQSRPVSVVEKDQRRDAAATIPFPMPMPVLPKPAAPVVPFPATPKISAPAPAPLPKVSAPIPSPKAASPLPFASERPAPPPSAAPAASGGTVVVNIEAVSAAWPDHLRNEIQRSDLGIASISIPFNRLEPGMKTGRVVFTWAELRGWLNSPVPPSPNGESQVELPLKVIAPLFLAKQRAPAARKVVFGGENLPDLFAGMIRPAAPTPAPAPEVAPPPPAPAAAPTVLGDMLVQPPKTDWTPQEIARRVMSLPGVAGAVLASSDGLRVAGQMPAPLNAETMAAFLPRIFTHTVQCAGEVQLGTLRAVRLSAGPAPCVICMAGNLYLAVLGQPGQTLPEAALEQLTVELAQHNN